MGELPCDPDLQRDYDALKKERDELARELEELRGKTLYLEAVKQAYATMLKNWLPLEHFQITREEFERPRKYFDDLERTGCTFEQIMADMK